MSVDKDLVFDSAGKQVAEYAMALDLLLRISRSESEKETISTILEFFQTLFSPGTLFFFPLSELTSVIEAGNGEIFLETDKQNTFVNGDIDDYVMIESGKGFLLKIRYSGKTLGILKVDDVAFPEYLDHYLNLSLSIAGVCGLAIENARRFQAIKIRERLLRKEKEKLEDALNMVKQLSGILPICSHCKKIRDEEGQWNRLENYIQNHSEADFSHSICPECLDIHYPEE